MSAQNADGLAVFTPNTNSSIIAGGCEHQNAHHVPGGTLRRIRRSLSLRSALTLPFALLLFLSYAHAAPSAVHFTQNE